MELKLEIHKNDSYWMNHLEEKGVIQRLLPGKHTLDVQLNESKHETIYATEEVFGPHKLICVTINREDYDHFLYHNANEEFMLLDRKDSIPLVMLFALIDSEELNQKIKEKSLSEKDFLVLEMVTNDPELSFFTMLKGFAHVEMSLKTSLTPPSFYVTESRDIDENYIDFKEYTLTIGRGSYETIRN